MVSPDGAPPVTTPNPARPSQRSRRACQCQSCPESTLTTATIAQRTGDNTIMRHTLTEASAFFTLHQDSNTQNPPTRPSTPQSSQPDNRIIIPRISEASLKPSSESAGGRVYATCCMPVPAAVRMNSPGFCCSSGSRTYVSQNVWCSVRRIFNHYAGTAPRPYRQFLEQPCTPAVASANEVAR